MQSTDTFRVVKIRIGYGGLLLFYRAFTRAIKRDSFRIYSFRKSSSTMHSMNLKNGCGLGPLLEPFDAKSTRLKVCKSSKISLRALKRKNRSLQQELESVKRQLADEKTATVRIFVCCSVYVTGVRFPDGKSFLLRHAEIIFYPELLQKTHTH